MIVKIFVTQNNFLNGPGISDRLLALGFSEIISHMRYILRSRGRVAFYSFSDLRQPT